MSSLHIWSHYGIPAMRSAGDANVNKPIADWPVWPYDERVACSLDQTGDPADCGPYNPPVKQGGGVHDPAVQAEEKNADSKGQWKVTEFDTIPNDPDAVAAVLATGADVWGSMDIGATWMHLRGGDTVADWNILQLEGGHAILFAGYRHQNGQRQFLVHNSWGKEWGQAGYAYVSEPMVKQFLKNAYRVVVANVNAPPPAPPSKPSPGKPQPAPTPPSPPPANGLTDDDCGANQLVDSVTGQCAQMCPDDSRPADGRCK
jgi:hypothetical protein